MEANKAANTVSKTKRVPLYIPFDQHSVHSVRFTVVNYSLNSETLCIFQ